MPRWQRILGWTFLGAGLLLLTLSGYSFVASGYASDRFWLTIGQLPIVVMSFLTGARLLSGSWHRAGRRSMK